MGSAEFVDAQKRLAQLGPEAFFDRLRSQSHAQIDEWQTQMQLKPMAIGNIYLYASGLESDTHADTCVNVVASLDQTVSDSLQRGDGTLAVIPEGPYVVPSVSA